MARNGRGSRGYLVAVVIIAVLGMYLLAGNVFIVREIEVQGNTALSDADVIRLSGLNIGGSIFRLDADDVGHALAASGKVKLVNLRTRMPDTVMLTVSERTPIAYVDYYGTILIVDAEGALIEQVATMPEEPLVYITGLKPSRIAVGRQIATETGGQVAALVAALSALQEVNGDSMVSEWNMSDPDNMYLIARSGMRVLVGDKNALADKLRLAMASMNDLQARGITQGTLDVRTEKHADFRQ